MRVVSIGKQIREESGSTTRMIKAWEGKYIRVIPSMYVLFYKASKGGKGTLKYDSGREYKGIEVYKGSGKWAWRSSDHACQDLESSIGQQ